MFIFRSLVGTQPVRPSKTVRLIGVILILSAVVFANTSWGYPVAFALAPFALIAGTLLGLAVMRTSHFWRDRDSGELWIQAGKEFLIVWGALIVVRIVLSVVAGLTASGPHRTQHEPWVSLAASFLVASMGLWVARAIVIYRAYRAT